MRSKSQALAPFGLTVPQYAALLVIAEHPGLSAADLARRYLVAPPVDAVTDIEWRREHHVDRRKPRLPSP